MFVFGKICLKPVSLRAVRSTSQHLLFLQVPCHLHHPIKNTENWGGGVKNSGYHGNCAHTCFLPSLVGTTGVMVPRGHQWITQVMSGKVDVSSSWPALSCRSRTTVLASHCRLPSPLPRKTMRV